MQTKLEEQKLIHINEKYHNGELSSAREDITGFLEIHESNTMAWILRGNILASSDLYWESLYAFQRALLRDEDATEAHVALGLLFYRSDEYDRATVHFEKALALEPEHPQALTGLGIIKIEQQEFKAAIELCERAYAVNKNDPAIPANLSIAYHFNGNYAKREEYYRRTKKAGYGEESLQILQEIYAGKRQIFQTEDADNTYAE